LDKAFPLLFEHKPCACLVPAVLYDPAQKAKFSLRG